jgi:hypothetical protein
MEKIDHIKVTECGRCGFVACICTMLKHKKACTRRKAVLDEHPLECTPHKRIACWECHPCDCGVAA